MTFVEAMAQGEFEYEGVFRDSIMLEYVKAQVEALGWVLVGSTTLNPSFFYLKGACEDNVVAALINWLNEPAWPEDLGEMDVREKLLWLFIDENLKKGALSDVGRTMIALFTVTDLNADNCDTVLYAFAEARLRELHQK